MLIARIKFAPWDKALDFSVNNISLKIGDYVVVETEFGQEVAKIFNIFEAEDKDNKLPKVIKKAEFDDLNFSNEEKKEEALRLCGELIKNNSLEMKLVDVYVSSSANHYNFAFISENRVDFRSLVKDLATRLGANIRLTQIGSRDEAKISGDCGPCGRSLCCSSFMNDFISISSEMAEAQQVVHRGSERISGMCGRLMCCLSYEYEGYKDLAKELPPIGTKVKVDGVRGVVISQQILKQTVNVRLSSDKENERSVIIEVDINRRRKEREEKIKLEEDVKTRKEKVNNRRSNSRSYFKNNR